MLDWHKHCAVFCGVRGDLNEIDADQALAETGILPLGDEIKK
jgi:hypothetical protein